MALFQTRKELESQGLDILAIIKEFEKRHSDDYVADPQYNEYSEVIFLGANDLEGRPDDIFFANKEDYEQWLIQN